MLYPKMLPYEVLLCINTTINRQAVLTTPIGNEAARWPVAKGLAFGNDATWGDMIISGDRTFALVINDTNAAATKLRRFNFATGDFTLPAQAPIGGVRRIVWSPDKSKFLVMGNTDPMMEVFTTATLTKDTTQIPLGSLSASYRIAFSPDGTKIAVPMNSSPYLAIVNFPAMTMGPVPASPAGGGARMAAWSPDGQWIATGHIAGTQRLALYDAATLTRQTLSANVGDNIDVGDLSFNPTSEYLIAHCNVNNVSQSVRLLRLSDKTFIPAPVASGHSFTNATKIKWLDDYTALWYANSSSNELVCYIMNVQTQTYEYIYIPLTGFIGWGAFSDDIALRRLAGTVEDGSGNPLQRTIRAYHRESGILAGQTVSGVDGTFEMRVFTSEPVYVVALGSGTEVVKVADPVTPAPPL